jgi:hypothetical protein
MGLDNSLFRCGHSGKEAMLPNFTIIKMPNQQSILKLFRLSGRLFRRNGYLFKPLQWPDRASPFR